MTAYRISDIASPEYMMSHILVQNDGTCTMGVTIVVQTFCQIDISRFPFDEQECTVNLGSAHYTADRMRVDKLSVVSKYESYLLTVTATVFMSRTAST